MWKINIIYSLLFLFLLGCGAPASRDTSEVMMDTTEHVFMGEREPIMSYDVGDINYAIKDSMIVDKTEQIVVTISQGLSRDEVLAKVEYLRERESNVVTNEIRIAPVMITTLIDPTGTNFRIVPITPEEQFLERGDITFWKWNVTPLNQGTNPLTLTVNIKVGDNLKNIEVYEDFIYVYSTDTFWDKFIIFFNAHWEWLFSTLLIPLFLYLYNRLKKRKRKNNI